MAIEAILFDYGNTLLSTRLDWKQVLADNLAGLEIALSPSVRGVNWERLKRDFIFMRAHGRKRAAEEHIETKATDSLRAAVSLQGFDELSDLQLQEGVDGFFTAEEKAYPVFFGIHNTISTLKSMEIKLGVISNATCGKLIRRALSSRNMLEFFDHITVSAEVGLCKPDPRLAEHALVGLSALPKNSVLVGDRLDTDIECAKRVGLRSILVDFFKDAPEPPADGPQPDAVVQTPEDLLKQLKDWHENS